MIALPVPTDFEEWRGQVRALWQARVAPADVTWGEATLFGTELPRRQAPPHPLRVPAPFVPMAETVFMHSDPQRLNLLYRLLWRVQSCRSLLDDRTDPDIVTAVLMSKAVRRDIHKMRAFVRFRALEDDDEAPHYVAWFEPDHAIVRANAGFFVRRFAAMRWSILTPQLCLHWDGQTLHESPGIQRPADLPEDPADDLWRSYYASIFNPARLKTKAMLKEMPRRYWKNMPEARLIPELIAGAQAREARMIAIGAAPDEAPPTTWDALRHGTDHCRRCPLYSGATQAVHGEGPHDARLMIVGEQPGDAEDLSGRPFVGPAGQILDSGLAAAGIDRQTAYVTNAVRHFKYELRGKRRLHQTPTAGEIDHCRWWLDAERQLVRPQIVVALGATAARGILGRTGSVASLRRHPIALNDGAELFVTTHPSYILRIGEERRDEAMAAFTADLALVAQRLNGL